PGPHHGRGFRRRARGLQRPARPWLQDRPGAPAGFGGPGAHLRERHPRRREAVMIFKEPSGSIAIVPSLLAADHAKLGKAVRNAEQAGAEWVSVDVMDGHFVPNLSFGPAHVAALRKETRMPIDAHLMVERPEMFVKPFADAGADLIIVHLETMKRPGQTLDA